MLTCLRVWSQVTNFRRVLDLHTCHPNTRVLVSSEEQCAFNSVGFKRLPLIECIQNFQSGDLCSKSNKTFKFYTS